MPNSQLVNSPKILVLGHTYVIHHFILDLDILRFEEVFERLLFLPTRCQLPEKAFNKLPSQRLTD